MVRSGVQFGSIRTVDRAGYQTPFSRSPVHRKPPLSHAIVYSNIHFVFRFLLSTCNFSSYSLYPYYMLLCDLVVRVPGCRSRGPGFDSRRYQIFRKVGGLERCPLSLVSITEELLGRNSGGSFKKIENTAVGIRHADHVALSIHKNWH
jgi:hypothetical protein